MTLTATKPQVDRGSPNSAVPLAPGLALGSFTQGIGLPWTDIPTALRDSGNGPLGMKELSSSELRPSSQSGE